MRVTHWKNRCRTCRRRHALRVQDLVRRGERRGGVRRERRGPGMLTERVARYGLLRPLRLPQPPKLQLRGFLYNEEDRTPPP